VRVAAVAGEIDDRLGHEGRPVAMIFRDLLDQILEEHVAIGGHQAVVVTPVQFELTVRI